MDRTQSITVPESVEQTEFATDRLNIDRERTTDTICNTLKGVTATHTDAGIKFRTRDGMLIAMVTQSPDEESECVLHHRTEPASMSATLKARRLWEALESHAA